MSQVWPTLLGQILVGADRQSRRRQPAAIIVGCAQRRTQEALADEHRLVLGVRRLAGQPGTQGDAASRTKPAGGAAKEGGFIEQVLAALDIPHHIERRGREHDRFGIGTEKARSVLHALPAPARPAQPRCTGLSVNPVVTH